MKHTEVVLKQGTSEDHSNIAISLCEKWRDVLPAWVNRLSIHLTDQSMIDEEDGGDLAAMMESRQEYREAILQLSPVFFAMSRVEMEETIVHEFMHTHFDPMRQIAARLADGDDNMLEVIRKENEGSVQDMALILLKGGYPCEI